MKGFSSKNRFVIGHEHNLFAGVCVSATCRPEILHAGAVKGLSVVLSL